MPKRKAASVSQNTKDDEVLTKSNSKRSKSGAGDTGVSIPSDVNIVWQLEDETKATWHNYHDDVQEALTTAAVMGRSVETITMTMCLF